MFSSCLKIALRNLRKHRIYSIINIAGLAVGMAVTILILLWVRHEISYDRFHQNFYQLYRVAFTTEGEDFFGGSVPGAVAEFVENEFPDVIRATRVTSPEGWPLAYEGQPFTGVGRFVDPGFFEMFTFQFIRGTPETAFADLYSAVITQSLATRIFGDQDPIGKTLRIFRGTPLTVTAVLEDTPENTHFWFEILAPARLGPPMFHAWDTKCLEVFVQIHEESTPEAVNAKIREVYNDHNTYDTANYLFLQPLKDIHLRRLGGGGPIVYVYIFSLTAAIVLLIACINFMNLSTARSAMRFKEIGMKKVVGASRGHLVLQFLSESVLLSLIALGLAIIIVETLLPFVAGLANVELELQYSASFLLSALGVGLLSGIISGSYPAFYLSAFDPIAVLRGHTSVAHLVRRGRGAGKGSQARSVTLRKILVVSQFTVSILFTACVVTIFSQIDYMKGLDLGFAKENVVLFNIPRELRSRVATVKNELLQNPNIESITISSGSLVSWSQSLGVGWEGKQPGESFDMGLNGVHYDYLETLQLEMAAGRFFSREFATDASQALVLNETAVRAMGMTDPVGQKIVVAPNSSYEREGRIIGVIKDYHTESAHKEIRPFMLELTETGRYMLLRIAPQNIPQTLKAIHETIREILPDRQIWLRFFDSELGQLYQSEEFIGLVIIYITVLAIFVSCLGLFGLAAFTAEQRTKEIGVRKALGASELSILWLLLKEFSLLILVASVIACPVWYLVTRSWLQNFAFRITVTPVPFCLAAAATLLIALGAVSIQAVRAARANPIDALRYE